MRFYKRNVRLLLWAILCLLPAWPLTAYAEQTRIAVLYPEARGGYRQIFDDMIDGIKSTENTQVFTRELKQSDQAAELNKWLAKQGIQSIVALGGSGYKYAKLIDSDIPVVLGALVIASNDYSGISLSGDPAIFFDYLEKIAPQVNRVFVVYSEENSGWLIKKARSIAAERKIKLVAHRADTLKQGLQHYDEILNAVNGNTDAIWLPLDRIVPDKVILPRLLRSAWDKKNIVFSNSLIHAKQGVLFSLYPDNRKMGQDLGSLAVKQAARPGTKEILPAMSLKIAVNKRTASHIGINFTKKQKRDFDIVFPAE